MVGALNDFSLGTYEFLKYRIETIDVFSFVNRSLPLSRMCWFCSEILERFARHGKNG